MDLQELKRGGSDFFVCSIFFFVFDSRSRPSIDFDEGKTMILRPSAFRPSGSKVKAISFHPVLPLLAVANEQGEIFVWDVDADAVREGKWKAFSFFFSIDATCALSLNLDLDDLDLENQKQVIYEDSLRASDDRAAHDALLQSLAERAPGAYPAAIRPPPPPRGAAAGAPRAVLFADADAVAAQLAAQSSSSNSNAAAAAAGATAPSPTSEAEAVRACKGLRGRRWLCVAADARLSLRDLSSSSSSSSSSSNASSSSSNASLELGRGSFDSRPLTALGLLCRCAPEIMALQQQQRQRQRGGRPGIGGGAAATSPTTTTAAATAAPELDEASLTSKQQLQRQRSLLRPTSSNVPASLDRSASSVASAAAAAAAASSSQSMLNPALVVGSASGSLFLVSLADAAAGASSSGTSSLAPFARLTGGHKGAVTAVLSLASPTDDGDALLTAAADGCVALWCPSSAASLATAAAARGASAAASGAPSSSSSAAGAAAAALATAGTSAAASATGATAAAVGAVTFSPSSSVLVELSPAAVFRAHDGPVTAAVLLRAPGQGPGQSGAGGGSGGGGPLRLATAGDREAAVWELGSWRPMSRGRPFASSSSSGAAAVDGLAVAGPGLAPGAPAGLEPSLLLVSGDDASGVFAARVEDAPAAARASTADLSSILPRGSKKAPKIYRVAAHAASDAVAVASNAGVLVLRRGGTGPLPLSPPVVALSNPPQQQQQQAASAAGGCSFAAAHGRFLWFCSFAAGWREDERGRRSPTADLRRRCPVAELPASFSAATAAAGGGRGSGRGGGEGLGQGRRPELSSSSCGRFVCVLWPETCEFVVFERPVANAVAGGGTPRASSGDGSSSGGESPWPRVGEGRAAAAAWADGGIPRLALLAPAVRPSSSASASASSSRSRGKGSKAAVAAAEAAAKAAAAAAASAENGPSVDVVEFAGGGEAGFVVALDVARKVTREARTSRRVAVGLHGGAMLGVVTVPAAGGGGEETEAPELSLLPWSSSDGSSSPDDDVTPALPAPTALAWSPNAGGLALSYHEEGGVTLLSTWPRLEPFARLPVPGVTSMLWGGGSSGGGGGIGGGGNPSSLLASSSSSPSPLDDGRRLLLLSADAVHVAFVSRLRGRSNSSRPASAAPSGFSPVPAVDLVCVARLGLPPAAPLPPMPAAGTSRSRFDSTNLSSSATTTSSPPTTAVPQPAARPPGALALVGCGETAAWVVDAAGRPHALPLSAPSLRARGLAAAGEAEAAVAVAERGGLGVPSGCAGGISSFCFAAAAAAAGGGGPGAAAAGASAAAAVTRLGSSMPAKARASLWRSAGKLSEALDVLEASSGLVAAAAAAPTEEGEEAEEDVEEEEEEDAEEEEEGEKAAVASIPWGAAAEEAISSSSSTSLSLPQFDPSAALSCFDDALAVASAAWARGDAAETSRALKLALAALPSLAASSAESRLLTAALRATRAGMRREASAALCALLVGRGVGGTAGDPLLSSSSSLTTAPLPRSALDLAAALSAALGGEVPGGAASAASALLSESGALAEAALWQRAWKGGGARAAMKALGDRLLDANGGEAAAAVV